MAKEIIVGLRLKADGSAAVRVLKETDSSLSKVGTSGRKAGAGLNKTANAAKRATSQLNLLQGAARLLGGYLTFQTARALIGTADRVHALETRVRTATKTTGDYDRVMKALTETSVETGAEIQTTVSVFQGLARSAPELGATNSQMLTLTKTVQQLGVISGASQASQRAGLLQFSQGLASGVFRAEEFNSLLENLPEVAVRIAKGLGVSVGELRQMVLKGRLASRDVFQSLVKQAGEISAEFAKIPPTVERSAAALKTTFSRAIADLDKEIGATQFLVKFIQGATMAFGEANKHANDGDQILRDRRKQLRRELSQVQALQDKFKQMGDPPSAALTDLITQKKSQLNIIEVALKSRRNELLANRRAEFIKEDEAEKSSQLEREAQQLEREGASLSERLANSAMDRIKRVDSQRSAAHLAELARLAAEKAAVDKAARARESLSSAIDRLKGGLSKEFAASLDFRSAIDLLDRGMKAHIITQQEFNDISKLAMDQFSLASDQVETATDRQAAALRRLANTNKETFTELRHAVDGWARDFATRMVDGSGSFRGFVTTVLNELQRIALAKASKPLFGAFGKLLEGVVSGFLPFAGGAGPAAGSFRAAQTLHSGGVAGVLAVNRQVPAGLFNGAPRYHLGGLAGNEVPAILRRGEEVLTRSDPRHRENAGSGGITIVNNIDARGADAGVEQRIQAAMRESEQRTIARIRDLKRRRRGSGL